MRSRTFMWLVALVAAAAAVGLAWHVRGREPSPRKVPAALSDLVAEMEGSDWGQVRAAAFALECLQGESVPVLLELADRAKSVALTDTANLAYPGGGAAGRRAETVPYDLDRLSARAGWILEAITFQSFGFREPAEVQAALEKGEEAASRRSDDDLREAARRAREWWNSQRPGWKRVDGLEDALASGDRARQLRAVHYLLGGQTPCSGLDEASFRARLEPHLERLAAEAVAGRIGDDQLARLVLSARPPEKVDLTVVGVHPGMTVEEAQRTLDAGPPVDRKLRRSEWKVFTPSAGGDVLVRLDSEGKVQQVAGNRLERDGKPVAREGQTAEQVRAELGPPWYASSRRRKSDRYRFLPYELTIRYGEDGKATAFHLEPGRPLRRPLWEQPRASGPGRTRPSRRWAGR